MKCLLSSTAIKKIVSTLLMCLCWFASQAQNSTSIIVKQKGGNETIFDLTTNPVITFEGENMVIVNSFTSITIPIDDIEDYVISKTATEVSELVLQPQYTRGHVMFTGLTKGTVIHVYTIGGKNVAKHKTDDFGIADINLDNLPKGIYIVKASNRSIKIINK